MRTASASSAARMWTVSIRLISGTAQRMDAAEPDVVKHDLAKKARALLSPLDGCRVLPAFQLVVHHRHLHDVLDLPHGGRGFPPRTPRAARRLVGSPVCGGSLGCPARESRA